MEVVVPGTLSGCPVVSIPAGFGERGLPMGIQLIGRPRHDLSLLQLARLHEQIAPWADQVPPDVPASAPVGRGR
jgi:amidase